MQDYVVRLQSPVSKSFRCQKAADSLDIDTGKKSVHELHIKADLDAPYNLGLIIGSSGSGKTTLARQIFGNDCFDVSFDLSLPVIEQFPKEMSYDDCANALIGIGLTSVPCWIRPIYTLSNGQRARAEAALALHGDRPLVVIDEWTSVVDRTVAKVMSHSIQKYAKRFPNKKIILLSCHYDIVEWVQPDWIIDCNDQSFRRSLRQPRVEKLNFQIREIGSESWKFFSKYHYLNENLPGGKRYFFGLFEGDNQVGFICYAIYVPQQSYVFYANRIVVHPDYVGLGLGITLLNETAKYMKSIGHDVRVNFSSVPLYKALSKSSLWRQLYDKKIFKQSATYAEETSFSRNSKKSGDAATFRKGVRMFSYEYRPPRLSLNSNPG